jgi:hypothetical protein
LTLLIVQAKKPKTSAFRQQLIAELNQTARVSPISVEEQLRVEAESYLPLVIVNAQQHERYTANPFEFWRDNRESFPTLSRLAVVFLCMFAGSVPVESLFSVTGLILNSRRSSLCPSKLNKLAFLHDNLDYVIELLNA